MLLVHHLEGLLVDLIRGQHVGHPTHQARDVRPAGLLDPFVLPEGHRGGLPARAIHPPVAVVEARTLGYGEGIHFPEDGDALVHLLRLDLDGYHACQHGVSPSCPPSPLASYACYPKHDATSLSAAPLLLVDTANFREYPFHALR